MAQKYSKAELSKKTAGDLHALAEDEGVSIEDKPNKATLVERLLELEDADDELDDELEEDDELDDEESDEIAEAAHVDTTDVKSTERKVNAAQIKAAAERGEETDEVDKPKKPKRNQPTEGTLAAKQVANLLGTEAKTLRQFFRSPASTVEAVGSGGRYEFREEDVPKIKREFETWRSQHAARGTKRSGKDTPPKHTQEVQEVEDAEDLDIEELDDEVDDEDLELDD